MRTRKEIEERLRTLTQAYHFTDAHRVELSDEAATKLRSLEEGIGLLRWCLDNTASEPAKISWKDVRNAFVGSLAILWKRVRGQRHESDLESS